MSHEKETVITEINKCSKSKEFGVPVSEIRPGTREAFVWDGTKFPRGCPGKRECIVFIICC